MSRRLEETNIEAKQRTCLKCNRLFDSAGPGNRICRRCWLINDRLRITKAQLQKQRGVKRHNGDPIDPCADEWSCEHSSPDQP